MAQDKCNPSILQHQKKSNSKSYTIRLDTHVSYQPTEDLQAYTI